MGQPLTQITKDGPALLMPSQGHNNTSSNSFNNNVLRCIRHSSSKVTKHQLTKLKP